MTLTSSAADALVDRVRARLAASAVKLGCAPEIALAALLQVATLGTLPSALDPLSYAQQTAIRNLAADWPRFETWSGDWRRWAEQGRRDDGSPFTWAQWIDFADVLGSDAATQAGEAWDGSATVAASQALAQTASDVVHPGSWPTWLKLAAAGVAALLLLPLVRG